MKIIWNLEFVIWDFMARFSFSERVLNAVKAIPRGKTMTYREVARKAGRPRAYRAVGNILNRYDAAKFHIPCYRVVRSDGTIGGYRWGIAKKRKLLKEENAIKQQ